MEEKMNHGPSTTRKELVGICAFCEEGIPTEKAVKIWDDHKFGRRPACPSCGQGQCGAMYKVYSLTNGEYLGLEPPVQCVDKKGSYPIPPPDHAA